MEIISEKTEKIVLLEFEFEKQEYIDLYRYARRNISKKVLNDMLVEWACVDILRKQLDLYVPLLTKKKKRKGDSQ